MLPEVGFPDPVIGQHLGRRAGRDDVPLAHDVSALANIQGFTDVMVRDQHPNIAGFEMRNDVFDIGNGDRVNACKGFIEKNHAGLSGERTRDFDPPTFAARQRLPLGISQMADIELLEQ